MCKILWATSPDTMDSSNSKQATKCGLHLYLGCFQELCLQLYDAQFATDAHKSRLQRREIAARFDSNRDISQRNV